MNKEDMAEIRRVYMRSQAAVDMLAADMSPQDLLDLRARYKAQDIAGPFYNPERGWFLATFRQAGPGVMRQLFFWVPFDEAIRFDSIINRFDLEIAALREKGEITN